MVIVMQTTLPLEMSLHHLAPTAKFWTSIFGRKASQNLGKSRSLRPPASTYRKLLKTVELVPYESNAFKTPSITKRSVSSKISMSTNTKKESYR
jgi:hypothetical protein